MVWEGKGGCWKNKVGWRWIWKGRGWEDKGWRY